MSRRPRRSRRRPLRRLLLGAALALILAVVVREPQLPLPLTGSIENAQVTHGLGLSPVVADDPGPCPPNHPPTVIAAATDDACLTIDAGASLHVTSVKSLQVVQEESLWFVRLELHDPDAASLADLTADLASRPSPHDELAIVLHGPPGGLVLSAPVVREPVRVLELDAGPTQAGAVALRDSLLR